MVNDHKGKFSEVYYVEWVMVIKMCDTNVGATGVVVVELLVLSTNHKGSRI